MLAAFVFVLTYVGLVYLRPQEYVPALQGVPVMPVFLAAGLLAWLPQRGKRLDAPQYWLLPLLLLAMALSVAANGWPGGVVPLAADFLPIMVLFYLIASATNTVARHRAFMVALGLFTTVLAAHGIDQANSGIGWSGAELSQGTRITYIGIFNDPNDLALTFVIAMPMLAYLLSEARGLLARALWLASMAGVLYAIYLTNSRGGMLALATQFMVYTVWRYGPLRASVPAMIGIAALLMLPTRLENLDADEASAAGRVDAWYSGIWMLLRNPVFGVGKGNFTEHHPLAAHNFMVLAFAELGLFGYFLWISFFALSVYMVYRASRPGGPPGAQPGAADPEWERCRKIARTYLFSMVGFVVAAMFLSRSYNLMLFVLCALCVAIFQCMRRQWPAFAPVRFGALAGRLFALELASVVFVFLLVKVLL